MKKKLISYILIFLLSLGFVFQFAKADSGWDVDYDSGSSWSSGSSWDSGSRWDDDDDYGSYSGSSGSVAFLIIFMIVIAILIISANKAHSSLTSAYPQYQEMSEEQIHAIDPDMNIEEFKNNVYETFIQIQNAWTNFDFDTLRKLLTDELYNMYNSQLQILKAKKQKNIMDNFSLDDIKIINMVKKEDTISVQVYLQVRFYDYVIEEKTKKVVRGDKSRRVIVSYVLTFVKAIEDKVKKCPNCGAEIEENTNTCPYCHTKFEKLSTKYILSKKTNLSQSKE